MDTAQLMVYVARLSEQPEFPRPKVLTITKNFYTSKALQADRDPLRGEL